MSLIGDASTIRESLCSDEQNSVTANLSGAHLAHPKPQSELNSVKPNIFLEKKGKIPLRTLYHYPNWVRKQRGPKPYGRNEIPDFTNSICAVSLVNKRICDRKIKKWF